MKLLSIGCCGMSPTQCDTTHRALSHSVAARAQPLREEAVIFTARFYGHLPGMANTAPKVREHMRCSPRLVAAEAQSRREVFAVFAQECGPVHRLAGGSKAVMPESSTGAVREEGGVGSTVRAGQTPNFRRKTRRLAAFLAAPRRVGCRGRPPPNREAWVSGWRC